MIAAEKITVYAIEPGCNALPIHVSQDNEFEDANQFESIPGTIKIDDAKMGGITPAIFSFSGR